MAGPDDVIAPAATVCREGSGAAICDPDESCTGEADAAGSSDVAAPATTICNPGSGDRCDPVNDFQAGTAPGCDDGVGCTDDSFAGVSRSY